MERPVLCPSAPAAEGAVILGVVNADGSIAYLGQRLIATREFVDIARIGREPERRFRFASPCRQDGCKQWVDGECGVPSRVKEILPAAAAEDHLPRCSIRPQCRWYRQTGAESCRICPWVITRGPVEDEISSAAN
ncbi:hypothetical protein ACFVOK_29690 [Streptomyces sp. NPDC057798]|uniref:hypothetical protein n=1 Tax=Streptomyces sp. NPDC057798 TaxID=3346252 RepID=UPI0036BAB81C